MTSVWGEKWALIKWRNTRKRMLSYNFNNMKTQKHAWCFHLNIPYFPPWHHNGKPNTSSCAQPDPHPCTDCLQHVMVWGSGVGWQWDTHAIIVSTCPKPIEHNRLTGEKFVLTVIYNANKKSGQILYLPRKTWTDTSPSFQDCLCLYQMEFFWGHRRSQRMSHLVVEKEIWY